MDKSKERGTLSNMNDDGDGDNQPPSIYILRIRVHGLCLRE